MSRLIMRVATVALALSLVSTATASSSDDHHRVGMHRADYASHSHPLGLDVDNHPLGLDVHKGTKPHCYTPDSEIPELPPWPPYCD